MATTWATTIIERLFTTHIIADPTALWVSPNLSFRIPDGNHPWLRRENGESIVDVRTDVPENLRNVPKVITWGFTGYDAEISRNLRIFANNLRPEAENARLALTLGTCITF